MPEYQEKNLYEGNNLTSAPEIICTVSFSDTTQGWDEGPLSTTAPSSPRKVAGPGVRERSVN